jgi:hypothetical protein
VWKERTRLHVVVDWEWWEGERGPVRITIANGGGRAVYIDEILLAESALPHHPGLHGWIALWLRFKAFTYPSRFHAEHEILHWLGRPSDPQISPGTNLHYFPSLLLEEDETVDWETGPLPILFGNDWSWRGLRIIVRSQLGKEWHSSRPSKKPGWFGVTPPPSPHRFSRRHQPQRAPLPFPPEFRPKA